MASFLCFGEILLRLSAPPNQRLFQGASLDTHFVGAEANVANLLARLGNDTHVFTVLPDNAVGEACQRSLMEQGVKTESIEMVDGRLGTYFFERGAMSRPSSITYDRAGSAFAEFDFTAIDWNLLLEGKEWLHVCGITLALGENTTRAALAAAEAAKTAGKKLSFDCNFRAKLWAGREAEMADLKRTMVSMADCLFAGRRDARYLLEQDFARPHPTENFAEVCEAYRAKWPNLTHIASTYRQIHSAEHNTLTGRYCRDGEVFVSPSHELHPIVDRIGGGDAFAGGLLHQIGAGASGQSAIDFAASSAAIKHSIMGDANLTSVAEIEALMAGGGGDVAR